jgi:hypothetical protein
MIDDGWAGMASAPRGGATIEVKHGPDQEIVRVYYSGSTQGWMIEGPSTTNRQTLDPVTAWRSVRRSMEGNPNGSGKD